MENTSAARHEAGGMWKRSSSIGSHPFLRGPSEGVAVALHRGVTLRARHDDGEALDRDAWSRLLSFLAITQSVSPGVAYERVHERLVRFFRGKGSMHAEELADATFDRVAEKLGRETLVDVRNPVGYVLGVARLIWLEYVKLEMAQRRRLDHYAATCKGDEEEAATTERDVALLDHCLAELPDEQRTLLLHYYRGRGQARIARRQELVRELQLNPGLLRTRVHRLRAQLERRVNELRAAETPAK
jgi:DNA-directed RNA polymerase specialized sigma24 family protein